MEQLLSLTSVNTELWNWIIIHVVYSDYTFVFQDTYCIMIMDKRKVLFPFARCIEPRSSKCTTTGQQQKTGSIMVRLVRRSLVFSRLVNSYALMNIPYLLSVTPGYTSPLWCNSHARASGSVLGTEWLVGGPDWCEDVAKAATKPAVQQVYPTLGSPGLHLGLRRCYGGIWWRHCTHKRRTITGI